MSSIATHKVDDRLPRFNLHESPPPESENNLAEDVRHGLTTTPKTLPPKYFYDDYGSRLFERICGTEEYYPTRTERRLLEMHATQIIARTQPATLIELGSGSAVKTDLLLAAAQAQLAALRYAPIDVSQQPLLDAGERIVERFDDVTVDAFVGEYEAGMRWAAQWCAPRLFVFLGGTIGNFEHGQARALLQRIAAAMGPDDWYLMGVDRVKDPAVLDAAYNDAQGLTADFNRNVLRVINRELRADFDPGEFAHQAFYDADRQQIEMHLVSSIAQDATIRELDLVIPFARGESIRTEISRKFTRGSLERLLHEAGLNLAQTFEPANEFFSLALARRI